MKKTYTKKQIQEAINYWQAKLDESYNDTITIGKLHALASRAEDDLLKNEDFSLQEAKIGIDAIRWFIQDWLEQHINDAIRI